MLSPTTEYLLRDDGKVQPSKSRSRKVNIGHFVFSISTSFFQFIWAAVFFLLGAVVILVPAIILYVRKDDCSTPSPSPTPGPAPWNGSDYISNSDYYKGLADMHDFTQADNLRLDRLSSPRFHPDHGKSVIYLRRQAHMPDINGSTTTLHWTDFQKNQTVQLTRPIWGINDQQVPPNISLSMFDDTLRFV